MIVRTERVRTAAPWVVLIAALGCAALFARAVTWTSVWVTALVGVAGAVAPAPRDAVRARSRVRVHLAACAIGVAAFGVVRWFAPPALAPYARAAVAAYTIAAIAEELFFRRFLYAWCARRSTAFAIGATAIAFALIHVPIYGVAVLPIDLGAGLLLSWQRATTGSWIVPLATHIVANLMNMR